MTRFLHPIDYYDHYLQSPESRVQALKDIQNAFCDLLHGIVREPEFFENLTTSEKIIDPFTPTIGVEIEIAWSSLFPQEYKEYFHSGEKKYLQFTPEEKQSFDRVCDKLDENILHLFKKTQNISIPAGRDAYWEFAFLPSRHYRIIFEEIRILRNLGLIPKDSRHSLQITLGGMSANRDAYMLLTILELINGDNAERIAGVNGKKYFTSTWGRRGSAGIRVRNSESDVLAYGTKEAIELRTLELPTDEAGISFLLETTQAIARIIQLKHIKTRKNPKDRANIALWEDLVAHVSEAFEQVGLDSHTPWGNPHDNPDIWAKFSKYLQTDAKQILERKVRRDIAVLLQRK